MPTRIGQPALAAIDPSLIARWRKVPVTIASDITAGRSLVDPRIRPLRPFAPETRLVGRARTGWCERGDFGPVLHAIDRAAAGDVLVIAAGGRLDTAVAGEVVCGAARRKGIAGLIVDGAVRDVDSLAGWPDFPVLALGATARGPLTREHGSVDEEVVVGGVRIAPNDVVLADNDGIIVFAPATAAALIDAAMERLAVEAKWEADLAKGALLVEVFPPPEAG